MAFLCNVPVWARPPKQTNVPERRVSPREVIGIHRYLQKTDMMATEGSHRSRQFTADLLQRRACKDWAVWQRQTVQKHHTPVLYPSLRTPPSSIPQLTAHTMSADLKLPAAKKDSPNGSAAPINRFLSPRSCILSPTLRPL